MPDAAPDPGNGILAQVPGDFVGRAALSLPDAETSRSDTATATIDAAWAGTVRITYERVRIKHGKSAHWAWCATRADAVDG
jgi:hypothetical protein